MTLYTTCESCLSWLSSSSLRSRVSSSSRLLAISALANALTCNSDILLDGRLCLTWAALVEAASSRLTFRSSSSLYNVRTHVHIFQFVKEQIPNIWLCNRHTGWKIISSEQQYQKVLLSSGINDMFVIDNKAKVSLINHKTILLL